MDLGRGLGHLTYSTLVHPGDTWAEIFDSLGTYVPRVKERVCPDRPFGVSLRMSASTAATLHADAGERERLRAFLADNDLYLYTVNAFPYGPFKNTVVKEQVYEPDWRSDERMQYTIAVADVLAEVCPPGASPSIQSSPLGFKPRVTGRDVVDAYTDHVLRVVAHLTDLERRSGRCVTLALEPEPACFLETTGETVAYFERHPYTRAAAETVARHAGIPVSDAVGALRRNLGVVFDTCHQALEYEDIQDSLGMLVDAGIPILKLQAAAALHVPEVDAEAVDALRRFADTIYLTQTIERRDDERGLRQYLNLQDAFAAWEEDPAARREWRVHVHVPVFLDDLAPFRSTRGAIADALELHRRTPLSRHLEIETYTWDVLPGDIKDGDIVDDVCRELEWVTAELGVFTAAGSAGP
jgi:hypothetical protein